jgi:hypothetical protein
VLRWIFSPKRDEVTGGWRKLRNGELHNLYFFTKCYELDKIEEDDMGWTRSTPGVVVNAYEIFV